MTFSKCCSHVVRILSDPSLHSGNLFSMVSVCGSVDQKKKKPINNFNLLTNTIYE